MKMFTKFVSIVLLLFLFGALVVSAADSRFGTANKSRFGSNSISGAAITAGSVEAKKSMNSNAITGAVISDINTIGAIQFEAKPGTTEFFKKNLPFIELVNIDNDLTKEIFAYGNVQARNFNYNYVLEAYDKQANKWVKTWGLNVRSQKNNQNEIFTKFADVNGDGKTDIVLFSPYPPSQFWAINGKDGKPLGKPFMGGDQRFTLIPNFFSDSLKSENFGRADLLYVKVRSDVRTPAFDPSIEILELDAGTNEWKAVDSIPFKLDTIGGNPVPGSGLEFSTAFNNDNNIQSLNPGFDDGQALITGFVNGQTRMVLFNSKDMVSTMASFMTTTTPILFKSPLGSPLFNLILLEDGKNRAVYRYSSPSDNPQGRAALNLLWQTQTTTEFPQYVVDDFIQGNARAEILTTGFKNVNYRRIYFFKLLDAYTGQELLRSADLPDFMYLKGSVVNADEKTDFFTTTYFYYQSTLDSLKLWDGDSLTEVWTLPHSGSLSKNDKEIILNSNGRVLSLVEVKKPLAAKPASAVKKLVFFTAPLRVEKDKQYTYAVSCRDVKENPLPCPSLQWSVNASIGKLSVGSLQSTLDSTGMYETIESPATTGFSTIKLSAANQGGRVGTVSVVHLQTNVKVSVNIKLHPFCEDPDADEPGYITHPDPTTYNTQLLLPLLRSQIERGRTIVTTPGSTDNPIIRDLCTIGVDGLYNCADDCGGGAGNKHEIYCVIGQGGIVGPSSYGFNSASVDGACS